MSKVVNLALRGSQFFWTFLILALAGNMIAGAIGGNPSIVNYVMFTAVFSMLSLVYFFAVTFNEGLMIFPWLPLAVEALNTFFFVIGGIALAAYLGVHSCGDKDYVDHNIVASGSYDNVKRCHEGQAVCAFLWFGFACYLASLVVSGFGSSGGANLRGGIGGIRRGGGQSMSQV